MPEHSRAGANTLWRASMRRAVRDASKRLAASGFRNFLSLLVPELAHGLAKQELWTPALLAGVVLGAPPGQRVPNVTHGARARRRYTVSEAAFEAGVG